MPQSCLLRFDYEHEHYDAEYEYRDAEHEFSSTCLQKAMHRQDEDFAVPHPSGAGQRDELLQHLFHAGVLDVQRDFDLRQKRLAELALAVLIQVALLPPKALGFHDTDRLDRRAFETGQDSLGQMRTNDGHDLFHGDAFSGGHSTGQPLILASLAFAWQTRSADRPRGPSFRDKLPK